MDKKEFAVIAAALQTYYPRFSLIPNEQAMELWYDGLKDIPADVATAGLKKWVMTEKWPPTIAELRKQCSELVTGVRPDWGEGWMEVQKAIRLYGYMRGDEALASMSAITRETVRRIGWQAICESESPETIRAQFRQIYEICEIREQETQSLPEDLKQTISQIREVADSLRLTG